MSPRRESEPQWLTPDELTAWMGLMAMVEALPSALDAQLKRDAGINGFEYYVLAALSDAPEHTLRMSELALLARGSLSRLSHAVGRLEKAGWVARRPNPEDGRTTDAWLTPEGMKQLERIAPGHVREARRLVIDVLTPTQLAQLGRAARAVVAQADPAMAAFLDDGGPANARRDA
jgi:DNA-binding MarR family transcriptional regulator